LRSSCIDLALAALDIDRGACRRAALRRTWQAASAQFLSHLVRIRDGESLVSAAAAAALGATPASSTR
jgi:hypothetical protein